MPKLDIGDAEIYYEEKGSGPPLLLVPVFLSAFMTLFGAVVCRREADAGGVTKLTALAAVLASLPLIWFMIRALVAS